MRKAKRINITRHGDPLDRPAMDHVLGSAFTSPYQIDLYMVVGGVIYVN